MLSNNNRQKIAQKAVFAYSGDLRDQFPLILAIAAFISFFGLGLMIIFWDSMLPNLP